MRGILVLVLAALLATPCAALSDTFSGKVVSVLDGDTITLMTPDKEKIKVRLYGINTPDRDQAYGQKAKRFTFAMTYGEEVEVKRYTTDTNGMTVGVVQVNGLNVNEEIIRSGYGQPDPQVCKASFCSEWLRLEKDAKVSGVGLWRNQL